MMGEGLQKNKKYTYEEFLEIKKVMDRVKFIYEIWNQRVLDSII